MQKLALYLWKNTMPGIGTKFTIWDRLGISNDGNKNLMAEAPSSIQVEALGVKAAGVSVRFEGDLVSSIDYNYSSVVSLFHVMVIFIHLPVAQAAWVSGRYLDTSPVVNFEFTGLFRILSWTLLCCLSLCKAVLVTRKQGIDVPSFLPTTSLSIRYQW